MVEKGFLSKEALTTKEQIDKTCNIETKTCSRKENAYKLKKPQKEREKKILPPPSSIKKSDNYKARIKTANQKNK